eukprot:2351567-Prymnesium_polylepis.1
MLKIEEMNMKSVSHVSAAHSTRTHGVAAPRTTPRHMRRRRLPTRRLPPGGLGIPMLGNQVGCRPPHASGANTRWWACVHAA